MDAIEAAGLPQWKVILLFAMTLTVIVSSHVHAACRAVAEVRGKQFGSWWRITLSYLARHEIYYAKQVPMLILFVLTSVAVVTTL